MARIANARNAADRWENAGVCSGVGSRCAVFRATRRRDYTNISGHFRAAAGIALTSGRPGSTLISVSNRPPHLPGGTCGRDDRNRHPEWDDR